MARYQNDEDYYGLELFPGGCLLGVALCFLFFVVVAAMVMFLTTHIF